MQVVKAVSIAKELRPDLLIEGPMQVDIGQDEDSSIGVHLCISRIVSNFIRMMNKSRNGKQLEKVKRAWIVRMTHELI